MPTTEDVYKELRQVYDPEIPVNIVDLGLVYDVKVEDTGVCNITMTLTSQACPEARTIPEVMKRPGAGPSQEGRNHCVPRRPRDAIDPPGFPAPCCRCP